MGMKWIILPPTVEGGGAGLMWDFDAEDDPWKCARFVSAFNLAMEELQANPAIDVEQLVRRINAED